MFDRNFLAMRSPCFCVVGVEEGDRLVDVFRWFVMGMLSFVEDKTVGLLINAVAAAMGRSIP